MEEGSTAMPAEMVYDQKKVEAGVIVETPAPEAGDVSATKVVWEPSTAVLRARISVTGAELELVGQRPAAFTDAVDVWSVEASDPAAFFLGCLQRELERRSQLSAPRA